MEGGNLVMAHLTGGIAPADIAEHQGALTIIDYQDNPQIYNRQLRKLDCPFIQRLTPDTRRAIERKSYFGAYKGVTDALTKYLWPELALWRSEERRVGQEWVSASRSRVSPDPLKKNRNNKMRAKDE